MTAHNFIQSGLRTLGIFAVLAVTACCIGCLEDPITGPQVVSQVVTAPAQSRFYATNFQAPLTGDLVVVWTHASSDTQQNFKGYLVRLYASVQADTTNPALGEKLLTQLGGDTVLRVGNSIDTTFTFPNIPFGRYTVLLNGLQFADSLITSRDTLRFSSNFDPRPLLNPSNIEATSVGDQQVKLRWDLPATDTNSGLLGYRIYYRDTVDRDTIHLVGSTGRGINTTVVSVPSQAVTAGDQNPDRARPFRFWVKSVRIDSVEGVNDSSAVVWAGATQIRHEDSIRAYSHSLYFGVFPAGPDVLDDSVDALGQVQFKVNASTGALELTAANGAMFNERMDTASSLDTVYYQAPVVTGFDVSSVELSQMTPGLGGIILYVQLPTPNLGPQYARLWIRQQADGSFATPLGGIQFDASYQVWHNKQMSAYLPYY